MRKSLLAGCALFFVGINFAVADDKILYQILPMPDDVYSQIQFSMSPDGAVVGAYAYTITSDLWTEKPYRAYVWNGDGYTKVSSGEIDIGGRLTAISNDGTVMLLDGPGSAALWDEGLYAKRLENGVLVNVGNTYNGVATFGSRLTGMSTDTKTMSGGVIFSQPYIMEKAALFKVDGSVHFLPNDPLYSPIDQSLAYDVSDDGLRAVGYSGQYAAVWSDINSVPVIFDHGDPNGYGVGTSISANGKFATGSTSVKYDTLGYSESHVFLWSEDNGFKVLDPGAGYSTSQGTSVSNAGEVVGSLINPDNNYEYKAFYYSQDKGIIVLDDYLKSKGVDLGEYDTLITAGSISSDGSVIMGYGRTYDQSRSGIFLLSLVGDIPGVSTPGDIINGIGSASLAGQQTRSMLSNHMSQSLFVARNAMMNFMVPDTGFGGSADELADIEPAAGDLDFRGRMGRQDFSTYLVGSFGWGQGGQMGRDYSDNVYSGAAGLLYKVSDDMAVGAGVVASRDKQNTFLGGDVVMKGYGLSALFAYEPKMGARFYATLTGMHLDLNSRRNYKSGSRVATSRGDTNGYALGGMVRAGYALYPWASDRWQVMPYVEGEYAHVTLDEYREKGGSFPARLKKQTGDTYISRLGGQLTYYMTPTVTLRGRAAWGHMYGNPKDLHVSVAGMSLSLPHAPGTKNWAEIGGSALWAVSDKADLGFDVTGITGRTAEPAINVMLGLNYKF